MEPQQLAHRVAAVVVVMGWALALSSALVGLPGVWQTVGQVSLVVFAVVHPIEIAWFEPRLRSGPREDFQTALLIGIFGVVHLWGRRLRA